MRDLFYCYSHKMCLFLRGLGFAYEDTDVNPVTLNRFWTFEKSTKLDNAIKDWSELKHKYM